MKECGTVSIVLPDDYVDYPYYEYGFEKGKSVYLPEDGDRSGYEPFLSVPYRKRLDVIELRGESLKGGFRMKDEYRMQKITTYGEVDE